MKRFLAIMIFISTLGSSLIYANSLGKDLSNSLSLQDQHMLFGGNADFALMSDEEMSETKGQFLGVLAGGGIIFGGAALVSMGVTVGINAGNWVSKHVGIR